MDVGFLFGASTLCLCIVWVLASLGQSVLFSAGRGVMGTVDMYVSEVQTLYPHVAV